MVDRGLIESRQRARAMIMGGRVMVDDKIEDKPGHAIFPGASIRLTSPDHPYVSRGGVKLEAALNAFEIDVRGKSVLDIGSSTGGFVDCLLEHGAIKVYAVDVGYGQLDWRLRNDSRVILLERTNIRYLKPVLIKGPVELVTIDVSFISLTHVIPRVFEFIVPDGEVLALIKPQFEVGPKKVGSGGIVREESSRNEAVRKIRDFSADLGFIVKGVEESSLPGSKGNIEYFIQLIRSGGDGGNKIRS